MGKTKISELPILLPTQWIIRNIFIIFLSCIVLETVHSIIRHFVFLRHDQREQRQNQQERQQTRPTNTQAESIPPPTKQQLAKTASQWAHLFANLVLASCGTYYWFFTLPKLSGNARFFGGDSSSVSSSSASATMAALAETASFEKRLTEYYHLSFFGCFIITYNVWSSFISLTVWGEEELTMTMHHILASLAGSLAAFSNFGWRYYTPYYFGVIEISSLPLSILNAFNIRPDWKRTMPGKLSAIQAVFVVAFITVRIILWFKYFFPAMGDGIAVVASYDMENPLPLNIRCLTIFGFMVPAFVLSGLQLFWLVVIIKSVRDIIKGKMSGDGSKGGDVVCSEIDDIKPIKQA